MFRVFFPFGEWLVRETWGWDQTTDPQRAADFLQRENAVKAVDEYRGGVDPDGYGIYRADC